MPPQDAKASEYGTALTPTQTQLLFLGILCMDTPLKIDMEKLAAMTGYQVTSARSNFNRALRKLKDFHEVGSADDAAKTADDNGEGGSGAAPSASKKPPKPRAKASKGSKRKQQNEKTDANAEKGSSDVEALEPVPSSSDAEALEPVPDSE